MKTKRIVLIGLFAAICFVGTFMHIPINLGGSNSMIHLGTTAIFISAIIIGKDAAFAGAIGCAIFDLVHPAYIAWVIPTLIIKGLTGYFVGTIAFSNNNQGNSIPINITAFICGGLVSLFGYFLVNWFVFVGLETAILKMSTSIITTSIGVGITIPVSIALKPIINRLNKTFLNI